MTEIVRLQWWLTTWYLRIKSGVSDHRIHKHPQVVFDHERPDLQLGTLVLALATVLGDVVSKGSAASLKTAWMEDGKSVSNQI